MLEGKCHNTVEPATAFIRNMLNIVYENDSSYTALFALCAEHKVPCAQIRAISNYTDDPRSAWDIPAALDSLSKTINTLF